MERDSFAVRAEGNADRVRAFGLSWHPRRGVRVKVSAGGVTFTIDASRVETVGPRLEAAALSHGLSLRLLDLDAELPPNDLGTRPSRVWAAIGNAADQRSVERSRGSEPTCGMFDYVGVEEIDGRRLAVDRRKPLVEPVGSPPNDFGPLKLDDASWHVDPAVQAGQPEEHAWTHIAVFLTWLIRRDLVDLSRVRPQDRDAIKAGKLVDRALMQWIDGKLVSDLMTDAGASFSESRYEAYTEAYGREFASEPDYSVPINASTYRRVEPILDALWRDWRAAS